jgi:hypothetical protein
MSALNEKIDSNIFVLSIWPGEWDLPSLDPDCLVALVK